MHVQRKPFQNANILTGGGIFRHPLYTYLSIKMLTPAPDASTSLLSEGSFENGMQLFYLDCPKEVLFKI